MARRTKTIKIEKPGRDQGKMFLLTEKSAAEAEDWALSVISALGRSGATIPEDAFNQGAAYLAAVGIEALMKIKMDLARPLLDAMFDCIQIIPDPKRKDVARNLVEDDIEDVTTRMLLRKEILELHLGFSFAASA